MKTILATVLSAVSASAAFAATWTNVESTQSNAKTATNWEGGSVPAFNNASAPVDVAFNGKPDFLQTVDWDANYNNNTWYLESVSGDRRRIVLDRDNYRNLVLADSSGFTGYIRSWHALNALYHTGDAGTTATVGQFMFTGRQNLRSHNAGATLSIDRAFGSGVFEVNRKMYDWTDDVGTIDIGTIEGGNKSWLVVNGGTVVLHGAPYAAPAIVGDPFLHLDASAGVETDEDGGRVFVTRWNDARGNGLYAEPGSATARPFVENGCVSFGSYVGEYAAYEDTANKKITQAAAIASIGPAGWLRLSSVRDDIREAFIVFRDNARLGHNAQFFGAPSGAKDVFARDCTRISNVDYIVPNLFMQDAGIAEIAAGDVRVDGVRIEGFARSETGNRMQTQNFSERLHVVSVGLDGTAAIDRIAAGEHGVGGLTIAEVVLYTNALSSVERRRVNAYLRAKWQTAEEAADRDLERLEFRKAISSLEVPSGTVRVGSLAVDSSAGSFTKTGEGTLEVENASADTAIAVAGGAVSFVSGVADALPDASEPAAKPDVWFDASKTTYDTVAGTGDYDGTLWATNWFDVRDGTNACGFKVVAEVERVARNNSQDNYGSWPVVAEGPFGRTVLDFGPGHTASAFAGYTEALADGPDGRPLSAAFEIKKTATATGTARTSMQDAVQRTFFVAINRRHIGAVVFGGEDFSPVIYDAGDSNCGKLDTGRAGPVVQGGVWTVNGEPFDPTSTVIPTNEWMVVGLETPIAASMFKIGARNVDFVVGGMQIGEILAYDRVLTAAERRQTETYLMRRWVDASYEPPARETSAIASLTFSGDADAVIDADVDMMIGRVEATGALVKKGSGAVSVAIPLNAGVTSLSVESGSLSVSMTPDLFRTAALHLDAGKTDFFDYADAAEGEIAAWRDCDGRTAYYAKSQATASDGGTTVTLSNGVLRTTADAASGLLSGKNYVSFGAAGRPSVETGETAVGGGMRFANSAGNEVSISGVREVHYVFRRRTRDNCGNPILGSDYSDSARWLVPYPYSDIIFYECETAKTSPKKLDSDDWHADNYWLASHGHHSETEFYVCSMAFTDSVTVNSIALDRNGSCGYGGIDLCELVIYTGATNTTLNADAIHSWLMAKWKGAEGGNLLPVTIDELRTADGATLNIDIGDNGVLQIGSFSLEVAFDAQGGWTQSEIAEDLHLPLTGNVRVTAAAGANIAPGDYTILTANSISGNANYWSIDSSAAPSKYRYSLFVDGNTLKLRVLPFGFMLIVR